ncbi:hypothetical protein MKZ38_006628 [Zalerion maritima]|uniref:non-specific serine/threonine protein kinase n=1 Tax=Zalerion maritima TaxID=339359 RepID=A0AAD5RJS4_9PEZI|nr:hypothetical protein MKZ38_006628 [Zalerion maritima]
MASGRRELPHRHEGTGRQRLTGGGGSGSNIELRLPQNIDLSFLQCGILPWGTLRHYPGFWFSLRTASTMSGFTRTPAAAAASALCDGVRMRLTLNFGLARHSGLHLTPAPAFSGPHRRHKQLRWFSNATEAKASTGLDSTSTKNGQPMPTTAAKHDDDDDHPLLEEERYPNYDPCSYYPARVGEVLKGKYKLISKLGWGMASTIWLAQDVSLWARIPVTPPKFYALKITNASMRDSAQTELDISEHMKKIRSRHGGEEYVRLVLDSFDVDGPHGRHLCLAFEPLREPLWMLGRHLSIPIGVAKAKGNETDEAGREEATRATTTTSDKAKGLKIQSEKIVIDTGKEIRETRKGTVSSKVPLKTLRMVMPMVLDALDFLHRDCHVIHTDSVLVIVLASNDHFDASFFRSLGPACAIGLASKAIYSPFAKWSGAVLLAGDGGVRYIGWAWEAMANSLEKLDLKGDHIMMPFENAQVLRDYADYQEIYPPKSILRRGRPVYQSRGDFGRLRRQRVSFVKLVDFGLAIRGGTVTRYYHDIQPLECMAPEVILKAGWSFPADIWNLGLVLWELLAEKSILNGRSLGSTEFDPRVRWAQMIRLLGPAPTDLLDRADRDVRSQLYDERGNFKYPELMPPEDFTLANLTPVLGYQAESEKELGLFIDFAKMMLTWDPEERATARELREHPWVKEAPKF